VLLRENKLKNLLYLSKVKVDGSSIPLHYVGVKGKNQTSIFCILKVIMKACKHRSDRGDIMPSVIKSGLGKSGRLTLSQ
jgi:hypothetical protein